MARPANGDKMIESLPGTPQAKARLAAIMATLYGGTPIPEACGELGISEARFHGMRKEFLASSLEILERKPAGRKPAGATPERLAELEDENEILRVELEAARIRTEIALAMPHLLKERLDQEADGYAEDGPAGAGTGMGLARPGGGKKAKKKRRRR